MYNLLWTFYFDVTTIIFVVKISFIDVSFWFCCENLFILLYEFVFVVATQGFRTPALKGVLASNEGPTFLEDTHCAV